MNLSQQTILRCAADLDLKINSSNELRIFIGDSSITCGPHGLLTLDTFATPRSLADGLARMRHSVVGMQDWIDLTTAVGQLYEAGVLCAERETAERAPDVSLYMSIEETLSAYNDVDRVSCMLTAIRETVRPGDVVLDHSASPGMFAIASAKAGAGVVYTVDDGAYAPLAQAAFAANGVADQIKLSGNLPALEDMPEPADVLIVDPIMNNFVFGHTLRATLSARRRLIKPNARILPALLRLRALPVTIPETELRRHTFTADVIANWQNWYSIDFSPFVQVAANSALLYPLKLHAAHDWPALAEPITIAETSPLALDGLPHTRTCPFTATSSGILNGIVLYMDVDYSASQKITSHPHVVAPNSCSHGFYWAFEHPTQVQVGEHITLIYGREPLSNDVWISVAHS